MDTEKAGNAFNIPCLVCKTVVKCDNRCLLVNKKKCLLFLLENLLEIPKAQVILNGEDDNWDDNNGQGSGEDNYWNVVKTCDHCEETVREASLIYGEIGEKVRKFREIQRKLVETFKINSKSTVNHNKDKDGDNKRLFKLINKCRGIMDNYDFSEFGFPFIVKEQVRFDEDGNWSDYCGSGSDDESIVKSENEYQDPLSQEGEEEAQDYEEEAQDYEEEAQDYEEEAQDYEEEAQDYEEEAQDYEEEAHDIKEETQDFEEETQDFEEEGQDFEEHEDCIADKEENEEEVDEFSPKPVKRRRRKKQTNPDNPWPCPLCHTKLKTFTSLKLHLEKVHPNNPIDFNELKLKYLQVNNPSSGPPPPPEVLQKAAKHLGISPFELEYPHLNCKRNSCGKFPCPWTNPSDCPRIFGKKDQLLRHLKVDHLKIKLFTCTWSEGEGDGASVCGKTFSTPHNFKDHLDEHRGTPKYKCEECGMTFYKRNPFVNHQQKMHSDESFICEICGQGFSCKQHLHTHKTTKHRNNPINTTASATTSGTICNLCGKVLKSELTFKNHMQVVHEKVPGKYCCHLCGKRFRNSTHLNMHLWEGHQFKPEGFEPKEKVARKDKLQCPVKGCRRLFVKKESLEKHGREVHGEDGKKPGAWNCKHCGKNFFYKEKWEQCEKTHENKERRPEKCEVCGKGFPTRAHLRFHQRSTHKMQLEKETRWSRKK